MPTAQFSWDLSALCLLHSALVQELNISTDFMCRIRHASELMLTTPVIPVQLSHRIIQMQFGFYRATAKHTHGLAIDNCLSAKRVHCDKTN